MQLATPPASRVYLIPKGNLVCICTKRTFCAHRQRFLSRSRGLSSRFRLRGTQGARVYTRSKLRPRPGSVPRALGVQCRAILHVITGSRFTEPEGWRTTENPHVFAFLHFCSTAVQPRSHGTTLVSSFPRSYSHEHLLMRVWTYLCMCALRVRTCARACGSACVCVLALARASFGTAILCWR